MQKDRREMLWEALKLLRSVAEAERKDLATIADPDQYVTTEENADDLDSSIETIEGVLDREHL